MDTYVRKNVDVILYVQTKYFQCWWRGYPWLCAGSASNTLVRDIAEEYIRSATNDTLLLITRFTRVEAIIYITEEGVIIFFYVKIV